MSLTVGSGPFGRRPAGAFNFELPRRKGLIYFEESPRRIRARLGGETVVDSRHPKLLHEHGHLPVFYFPEDEVRMDLLEPTDHSSRCPWKMNDRKIRIMPLVPVLKAGLRNNRMSSMGSPTRSSQLANRARTTTPTEKAMSVEGLRQPT